MRQAYIIESITHSGRKGLRGTSVDNPKYMGLIGARCMTDISEIKQYEKMHLDIPVGETNCPYDWWDTTAVLEIIKNNKTGEVTIETANTIYTLQEVRKCYQKE